VAKLLCNEPFNLRPWEVAQLTPLQVKHLYLCERDENGGPVLGNKPTESMRTNEERFYRHWELNGLADRPDLIEQLWEDQKAKDAEYARQQSVFRADHAGG
jgi:hypothetical protein